MVVVLCGTSAARLTSIVFPLPFSYFVFQLVRKKGNLIFLKVLTSKTKQKQTKIQDPDFNITKARVLVSSPRIEIKMRSVPVDGSKVKFRGGGGGVKRLDNR